MHVQEMNSMHPDVQGNTVKSLRKCILECYNCDQFSIACADLCTTMDTMDTMAISAHGQHCRGSLNAYSGPRDGLPPSMEECGEHTKRNEQCRICMQSCKCHAEACQAALPRVQCGKFRQSSCFRSAARPFPSRAHHEHFLSGEAPSSRNVDHVGAIGDLPKSDRPVRSCGISLFFQPVCRCRPARC